MDVGIRELKAKLSHFVAEAADGATVTITDRGRPVAKLVPIDETSNIERGIEEGWVEPPLRTKLAPALSLSSTMSIAVAIEEDRG